MLQIQNCLVFSQLNLSTNGNLEVLFNITVFENLQFEIFCLGTRLEASSVSHIAKPKLTSFSELSNIISFAKNFDVKTNFSTSLKKSIQDLESLVQLVPATSQHKLEFFIEQIQLSFLKDKRQRRYSVSLLSLAVLWENCSPALYSQIIADGVLCLPSRKRIHDLTKAFSVDKGLSKSTKAYLQARAERLNDRERIVMLQEDEIFSAKRIEYSAGKITGLGSLEGADGADLNQATKTMLCVMVKSVAGSYFDVIALFPIYNLVSSTLKNVFDQIVSEMVTLNFKVVANGLDAYSANRKFYVQELCKGKLQESVKHQSQPNIPIHLIFDAVHVFKNIFNNFLNKRKFCCPPFEEDNADIQADIEHITNLYKTELGKPCKKAFKLTDKVLNPQPIERTKVLLADAFFHDSTIEALEWYAVFENHPEWANTAKFLRIIRKWWNIVNVRTLYNGQMKRDETKDPIRSVDAWQLQYLERFAKWLQSWQSRKKMGLTSETFLACTQTTKSLRSLAIYLLQNGVQYVLLGLSQSDSIENRFGWYRNLNGSNYHISVRQILSAEKAIRVKSLLQLSHYTLEEAKTIFQDSESSKNSEISEQSAHLCALMKSNNFNTSNLKKEEASTAFYIAGYCVHGILKRVKCESCRSLMMASSDEPEIDKTESSFLEQINRGRLITPSHWAVMSLMLSWSYYDSVTKNEKSKAFLFGEVTNQAEVFVQALIASLEDEPQTESLLQLSCCDGHSFKNHFKEIGRRMFNIGCKNLVAEINSEIHAGKKRSYSGKTSSERKISKLQ